MAGSDSSKDTQEEKPQRDSVEDQYETTDWPSCLKLDVRRAKNNEDLKGSVILSCMKLPKDENPGEERICPSYTCISGPTQRNCSAISFIQIYYLIQCSKAGQELQQEELESLKCWAKSTEDPKDLDLCCSPEVMEKATAMYIEKFLAAMKSITTDPQEANLDHQTLETPRDHQISRRKIRNSAERRDLGNPTPMLDHPNPTHIPLCLDTNPGYQHPELGQESSQGWVIGAGAGGTLGALVFLVLLGVLVVKWWRGRREESHSSKEALRAEEGLEEDGDGDTPLM